MAGEMITTLPIWVVLVLVWSVVWKAIASWKAARNGHIVWFVLFWVLNTAGILPIVYILFFSKNVKKVVKKKGKKK